jgi:hypothetical protein|tara:strand:+ start:382 stop:504 length:123 start_codon:yes stop_codon:yes gene_type:complete
MPTGIGIAVGGSAFRVPEKIREKQRANDKLKAPPPPKKKK